MDHFKLVSEYKPTGDQPQAIEQLVKGFKEGNQFETLLGVTGSGKTFTMANVIEQLNRPTLIIAHNTLSPTTIIISRKPMFLLRTLTLKRTLRLTMRLISCVTLPLLLFLSAGMW